MVSSDIAWLVSRSFTDCYTGRDADSPAETKETLARFTETAESVAPSEAEGNPREITRDVTRGVVVAPTHVDALADAPVRVVSVAGFPTGRHHRLVKAAEARLAVQSGASEVWIATDPAAREYNHLLSDFAAFREAVPAPAQLGLVIGQVSRDVVTAARAAGFDRLVIAYPGPAAEAQNVAQRAAEEVAQAYGGLEVVFWAGALDDAIDTLSSEGAGVEAAVLPLTELL